jgi:hypothetical protein
MFVKDSTGKPDTVKCKAVVHLHIPPHTVVTACIDVSSFVRQFHYLTIPRLSELAAKHRLDSSTRRSVLITNITKHVCEIGCPAQSHLLVFRKLCHAPECHSSRSYEDLVVLSDVRSGH